jgi:hypothetical protein
MARDFLEVVDELAHLGVSRFVVTRAQDRRRMNRRSDQGRQWRFYHFAALTRDAKIA